MIHPQHKPAEVRDISSDPNSGGYGLPGAPERFPPIEVHSAEQEEETRARGYLRYGETVAKVMEFNEYPKMMRHPDHAEAVPATQGAQMVDGKLTSYPIAGTPEKWPDAIARSADEEAEWVAKGYASPGKDDPVAFERATLSPGKPGDEWPKWIDGVLAQDPEAPVDLSSQYPKWLHFKDGDSVLVNDPAHERRVLADRGESEPEKQPDKPYVPLPEAATSTPDPDYAEFLAWKAAKAAEPLATIADATEDEERAALMALAEETGVTVDKRWGLRRLREAVMGAEAAE